MCKVTLTFEDGTFKSCFVAKETPDTIFKHFRVDTSTKIVYMNGKALSKDNMCKMMPDSGLVHFAVRNKTVMRV